MQIDAKLVERLLYEEESNELDFKREQYKFSSASDLEKSEILKDIIAFANSWRRSDAFILLGVDDVKGGKSVVVGIAEDLDDADLQQFINSKTQRPVDFSYRAIQMGQDRVGVVHIPLQHRPLFVIKDYGKVKAGTVYVRRGSSTAVANLDEIAKMGSEVLPVSAPEPKLKLELGKASALKSLGTQLSIEVVHYSVQGSIPDYKSRDPSSGVFPEMFRPNNDYYREMVRYVRFKGRVRGFNVAVTNEGDVLANGVRVLFEMQDTDDIFALQDGRDSPRAPELDRSSFVLPSVPVAVGPLPDVVVRRVEKTWYAEAAFEKIQPKDTSWTRDKLMIGANADGEYTIPVKIFADNLSHPVCCDVTVTVRAIHKDVNYMDLEELYVKQLREEYDRLVAKRKRDQR